MSSISLPTIRIQQTLPAQLKRTTSHEILRPSQLHLKIEKARGDDPRFVSFFRAASQGEPKVGELPD